MSKTDIMGKGDAPAYQVYAAKEMVKMLFLDWEERGLYSWLRHLCWEAGKVGLPELHAMAQDLPEDSLKKVLKLFRVDGDFVIDDGLEEQRRNHAEFRKRQSQNARKRWQQKEKPPTMKGDAMALPPHGAMALPPAATRQCSESSSSSHPQGEKKKKILKEEEIKNGDHDKKKELEKMEIEEITKSDPGVVDTDHSGGDVWQQTNGGSPQMDDRPEGVRKFLENIKAPKRAAPIVGTWGEDDPHPTI